MMQFPTLALLLLFAAPLTGSVPLPEPEPSDAGPPSGSALTQTVGDNSTLESADLVKRSVTCKSCSMVDWVSFGDSDPHVSVKLRRSPLVRPICFDLHGVPNDFFVLYTVPVYNWATSESSLLSLTGHLARSRRPGQPDFLRDVPVGRRGSDDSSAATERHRPIGRNEQGHPVASQGCPEEVQILRRL